MSHPQIPDGNTQSGVVFDMLLESGMIYYPAAQPGGPCGDPAPLRPLPTRDGRYVHIKAILRDDYEVAGLLIARDGPRFVVGYDADGGYTTFNADTALMVTVSYLDTTAVNS